jgi:hypothetical protein
MDKALIAQAAQCLKLRNIVLYENSLKRFGEIGDPKELGQLNKLIVRGETGEALEADRTLHLFRVFVDLGVRVVESPTDQGQEAIPLFQIARYNAVHNAWPFWRQFVFSTANQAGLPCPEVPLRTECLQQGSAQID